MGYGFFVADGPGHGVMIKEFRQAACMIDMDMGQEDQVDPAQAHGGEGVDEISNGIAWSYVDDHILFTFKDPGSDESIKTRSILSKFYKDRIHKKLP